MSTNLTNNNLADSMPLAKLIGLSVTHAQPERVEGELTVRADLCTTGGSVHGGTLMAMADSLGAVAAFLNLPDGAAGTTTIESKTNFLRAAPEGATLRARTTPINIGRRIAVLSTEIARDDGKTVAIVTQSQMVL